MGNTEGAGRGQSWSGNAEGSRNYYGALADDSDHQTELQQNQAPQQNEQPLDATRSAPKHAGVSTADNCAPNQAGMSNTDNRVPKQGVSAADDFKGRSSSKKQDQSHGTLLQTPQADSAAAPLNSDEAIPSEAEESKALLLGLAGPPEAAAPNLPLQAMVYVQPAAVANSESTQDLHASASLPVQSTSATNSEAAPKLSAHALIPAQSTGVEDLGAIPLARDAYGPGFGVMGATVVPPTLVPLSYGFEWPTTALVLKTRSPHCMGGQDTGVQGSTPNINTAFHANQQVDMEVDYEMVMAEPVTQGEAMEVEIVK
eukprot:gene24206-9805_t